MGKHSINQTRNNKNRRKAPFLISANDAPRTDGLRVLAKLIALDLRAHRLGCARLKISETYKAGEINGESLS